MSSPLSPEQRALLDAYRRAAGPDAETVRRIRANVTAKLDGGNAAGWRWRWAAAAAAIAAIAIAAWVWSNQGPKQAAGGPHDAAGATAHRWDSGNRDNGSTTAGSAETDPLTPAWRQRVLERIRARQRNKEQFGNEGQPRRPAPHKPQRIGPSDSKAPDSAEGSRDRRGSSVDRGVGGGRSQFQPWRPGKQIRPGSRTDEIGNEQHGGEQAGDGNGEEGGDGEDEPTGETSSPEEMCEQGKTLCLESADEQACAHEYSNCLIDFACEAFRRDQCLAEFSEEDCQIELEHCHARPAEYFWEVCRFRLNACTEEQPDDADTCEQRTQPCFDAATELFGPEPP